MKIPQDIIKREPQQVLDLFTFWYDIMDRKVDFWPLKGEFDIHTEGHCERVLLLALKIGARRRLSDRQMEALCHASIFHDTRRLNNYLDKGHGERAACYYKEEARQMGITFLPEAYAAIRFHDQDDKDGEAFIKEWTTNDTEGYEENDLGTAEAWTEVFRDFKDADALDRLRMGPWTLDKRFLRTEEAKGLIGFAQELVDNTMTKEEYKKITDATRPFADKFSNKDKEK